MGKLEMGIPIPDAELHSYPLGSQWVRPRFMYRLIKLIKDQKFRERENNRLYFDMT